MSRIMQLFHKFKPGVPKWVLIFLGATLWGFAAYRILKTGIGFIETHSLHQSLNYLIGFAGFVPFFLLVFRKVSYKYLNRIKQLPQAKPCVFAFFNWRGYLIMSLMITMGIALGKWQLIPELYKGTFFISLGLSLLASSVMYCYEGVQYINQHVKQSKKTES
jgi:hypothetical protein